MDEVLFKHVKKTLASEWFRKYIVHSYNEN